LRDDPARVGRKIVLRVRHRQRCGGKQNAASGKFKDLVVLIEGV
jgi:hypothetical protein